MKKLLIIILLLLLASTISYAQEDTIKVPQAELDEIIATIDILIEQDSINTAIIKEQTSQILLHETLAKQDSLLLSFKNQEIVLYSEQLKLYEQKIKVIDKWYNTRAFGFILGVTSTILLIHSIDYTLP
jgi:hypothetical protein